MKLIILLSFLSFAANAQSDTTASFLSKLYFPFDVGYALTNAKTLQSGMLFKTGLEYRFKQTNGLFIRFNYDNRSNHYKITENTVTDITEGKLKFTDYVTGVGYRVGSKKTKVFGLIQSGISAYSYLSITGFANNFTITDKQRITPILKCTAGFEYYIAKNAALTLETSYALLPNRYIFWGNDFSIFGISLGLTTTLF